MKRLSVGQAIDPRQQKVNVPTPSTVIEPDALKGMASIVVTPPDEVMVPLVVSIFIVAAK